jgi:hypothetical protein
MSRKVVVTEKNLAEILGICREITRVLDGLESEASQLEMIPKHASLQAHLAVLLSRLRAGDSSLRLVLEMNAFVREYNAHVEMLSP